MNSDSSLANRSARVLAIVDFPVPAMPLSQKVPGPLRVPRPVRDMFKKLAPRFWVTHALIFIGVTVIASFMYDGELAEYRFE